MGISPINHLAALPTNRFLPPELEPLPMERVEMSPRTGDETYSPSNGKSSRGAADDSSDDAEDEFMNLAGEEEAEPSAQPAGNSRGRQISFFA
jgi:hypothetical protein